MQPNSPTPAAPSPCSWGRTRGSRSPAAGSRNYLTGLPSKRRVAVRRERRAFTEAGYELRTLRLSECADSAGALLAQLQQGHGHAADPGVMARLLRDQADGGVVLAAYADGRMVAFSLSYRHAGTVWLRATGYDYARLRGAHEYFNLVYYFPSRTPTPTAPPPSTSAWNPSAPRHSGERSLRRSGRSMGYERTPEPTETP
ncbi:GNAT family N-acetyltransferase [Streptomyces sp. NPDC051896]|uniref:GNAT family N-acetyltransferase n=1 Tax=Streptomyces sp. NPDC051896 TaxID=3155416 RepID=UPI0034208D44